MASTVVFNNVPASPCMQLSVSVATPDGGFLYTGIRSINYIAPLSGNDNEAPEIKTMSTRISISALDVSPMWGKQNNSENHGKQFAIVAEDLSVQVWDCVLGEAISGHKAHQHQREARELKFNSASKEVMMSYISNGNILSIDANDLVVYCVASNSYYRRPTFIPQRNHQITVLRCSPYSENLFAIGTTAGTVIVCDLFKMSITYKFNGHKSFISDLAWKEMPIAIDNSNAQNLNEAITKTEHWRNRDATFNKTVTSVEENKTVAKENVAERPLLLEPSKNDDADELFDIYNYEYLDSEFGAPASVRPRPSSKSSDDCADFVGVEKLSSNVAEHIIDYVEACANMKAELLSRQCGPTDESAKNEVTLDDCKESKVVRPCDSSSCSSVNEDKDKSNATASESSAGSLELIQYSCSSDDAVIVDGDVAKPKHEVLHHIYHQAEVHSNANEMKQPSNMADLKAPSMENISSRSDASTIRPDMIVVSIDSNDVIMFWNALTGGHCGKNYIKKNSLVGTLNELKWLNDNVIVSKSRNQLNFWSVHTDNKSKRLKLFKAKEFCCPINDILTFSPCLTTQEVWLCKKQRDVILFNPLTSQSTACYGCLSFGLRAITECPHDMNKIALGCADRRIALFDISKLSARCISIDSVQLHSAIYSLAWSPDSTQLAFGTFEGQVGIIDAERMKIILNFPVAFKKEVYSLVWKDNYIYFIANRVLGLYDVSQPKKEAVLFANIKHASYISVRNLFLFVGTDDGFLQLYERKQCRNIDYISLRQQALTARYITDIGWNPIVENQFAVVGNDKFIFIIMFLEAERNWKIEHTFTAIDKNASITSLKWSNMEPHLLLTFHIEGKVCMWNTNEPEQPPLTITYHCPMWCGMFLPSDEDVIMCSGKSCSLEFINIKDTLASKQRTITSKIDSLLNVKWAAKSQNQGCASVLSAAEKKRRRNWEKREQRKMKAARDPSPQDKASERKAVKRQPAAEATSMGTINDVPEPIASIERAQKAAAQSTVPIASMMSGLIPNTECQPDNESSPMSLAHSRMSLFLTQKELNKYPLEKLSIVLSQNAASIEENVLTSNLFGSIKSAKAIINIELENLQQSKNMSVAPFFLKIINFELVEELELNMKNKTLNEGHLSLAPYVSFSFWQRCCEAFAKQLRDQGRILQAAMYFIAIQMRYEAIDLLLEHEYFKEALLLARIHLTPKDKVIKHILNKWLNDLESKGNLAAAALICVLDNDMMRGYMYLRKFRNHTAEITRLMGEIKRIGKLDSVLEEINVTALMENTKVTGKSVKDAATQN